MSKKFYPVIHCVDPYKKGGIGHALANVKIARDNGADGVFLIGHSIPHTDLSEIYRHVRKQHSDFWIGINFLDMNPLAEVANFTNRICPDLDGYWTDHNKIFGGKLTQQVFAGVAFKYMDPHQSGQALEESCRQVASFADVATTSGDKTGSPPAIEKLEMIKRYLGDRVPLAVASGVDARNITAMKPFVDIFLVASSIIVRDQKRGNHEYLVPEKVRELAGMIHM